MKIADSVLLSLLMRDNGKCNISPSSGLSILNVLESLIPKDQKYNNNEMKPGQVYKMFK